MRIVYHLGAHCTDEERLVRCLLKNRTALSAEGIVVPGPARYRTLLRDTAMRLRGQPASRDTQALLLDQIMDEDRADRLILAWDNFLGFAQGAVADLGAAGPQLYPAAGKRMAAFAQVFPEIEIEFHLAIRNPATFLPALRSRVAARHPDAVLPDIDPAALRWSDLARRLRSAVPDAPLTVWCDEDTPLLWPDVLRTVSGHAEGIALDGTTDLLETIMQPGGLARMQGYLAGHPPADAAHYRRIVSAFLGKFARTDAIEQEVEMPGWDETVVARATEAYDRDVSRIMRIEGVTFLAP